MKGIIDVLVFQNGRSLRATVRTVVPLCVVVTAAVASLAPAFAETYTAWPVSVGTDGSNSGYAVVSVSEHGCSSGDIAVAVGDGDGCEFDSRGNILAIGLLGAEAGGGEWAVSDTGDASVCNTWGCFLMPVAVSGTGGAAGNSYGGEAVSITGDASARANAVSGTGNAYSESANAVSVAGSADGGGSAISLTRDATSRGGMFVIAGRNANGGSVTTVAITGHASTSGPHNINGTPVGGAAIAGEDANANGGWLAVSLAGNACGASVYAVAPLGQAC